MSGGELRGWPARVLRGAVVLVVAALACGKAAPPAPDVANPARIAMNGFMVPVREIDDPTLVDSCLLLTASHPEAMIQEALAPLLRMSNVCLAFAASTPELQHSLTVELRHPEPIEIAERGGVPTTLEQFWAAEGAGIRLMGGKREDVRPLAGIGDLAVWYPMTGGMALHAYWQGSYILAVNARGVDPQRGLAWSSEVAVRAIRATAELEAKTRAVPAPGGSASAPVSWARAR